MPSLFNPRLVNPPSGDPGIYVPLFYNQRALLFDIGDIHALSPKEILKITHVFVTHTHMDHFIGFDYLLRILLGRQKTIYLYGPEGFIAHISGKLSGYSWNLVHNYANPLVIMAMEISGDQLRACRYECRTGFRPEPMGSRTCNTSKLHSEDAFIVEAAALDHGIPCLGYSIRERFHINIRKDVLKRMGLVPGPWLYDFKESLYAGKDPETPVDVPLSISQGRDETVRFTLGGLARDLVLITDGQKITYITDAAGEETNIRKMINLAQNADHLFIEAAFLDEDRHIAKKKQHLTAYQAGMIAAKAGAKRFTLFHFSPRYTDCPDLFQAEAARAFQDHAG